MEKFTRLKPHITPTSNYLYAAFVFGIALGIYLLEKI